MHKSGVIPTCLDSFVMNDAGTLGKMTQITEFAALLSQIKEKKATK